MSNWPAHQTIAAQLLLLASLLAGTTLSQASYAALTNEEVSQILEETGKQIVTKDLDVGIARTQQALANLGPDVSRDNEVELHVMLAVGYFLKRDLQALGNEADIAIAKSEGLTNLARANALSLQVMHLGELGQAEESLAWAEQELAVRRALPEPESELSNALTNMGISYAELGQYKLAEQRLNEALAFSLQYESETSMPDLIRTNMAFVYGETNQYARALALYQQTVASARQKEPDTVVFANRLANLGMMQTSLGLYTQAMESLSEANALQERIVPESIDLARSYGGLAQLYRLLGEPEKAVDYARRSWHITIAKTPDSIFECIAGSNFLQALLKQNTVPLAAREEAAQVLGRVAPLSERLLFGTSERAEILHGKGLLAKHNGDLTGAIDSLEQAVATLQIQYALIGEGLLTQASFSAGFADLFALLAQLYLETGRPADALSAWERFRHRQLTDRLGVDGLLADTEIGSQYLADRQTLRGKAKKLLKAMQANDADSESVRRDQRKLADLVRREQQQGAALAQADQRFAALLGSLGGSNPVAGLGLEQDERVIYYALGDTASHAVILSPTTTGEQVQPLTLAVIDLTGQDTVDLSIMRLRTLLRSADSDPEQIRVVAAQLYESLWRPLAAQLEGANRVTIIPDGKLHWLPFAALFDERSNRYLLESHTLRVAHSLADLRAPARQVATSNKRFMGFAYSKGSAIPGEFAVTRSATDSLELLPLGFAAAEVRNAASRFAPNSQVWIDDAATEQAVWGISDTDILHFSTHAVLNQAEPLNSYLALAAGDKDDGRLQLGEIMNNMRLDSPLVVLSACDSAVGPLYPGEGLIGLSKAFAYAGAEQVIATLWPVYDEVSAQFMGHLYDEIAAGATADAALRAAQLGLLHGQVASDAEQSWLARLQGWWNAWSAAEPSVANTQHPYYWASYFLSQSR